MKTPIHLVLALLLSCLATPGMAEEGPTYWDLYEKARTALKAGDHRTYAATMKDAVELLPLGDPNRATSLYELARGQALAGEPEASLAILVRLWDEKTEAPLVFFAETDAAFEAVRALPGFRALLGRIGEIQLQVIPVKGTLPPPATWPSCSPARASSTWGTPTSAAIPRRCLILGRTRTPS